MKETGDPAGPGRWTRGQLARRALGLAALAAGGTAMGVRGSGGTSVAAPSKETDADILNLFLLLERVQEAMYEEAARAARLPRELLEYAKSVGEQETAHVAFLEKRLGGDARERPSLDFPADMLERRESFLDAAIELEEAAIGAYIDQSANLTRGVMTPIATLVAVEARQAAWIRDIAGTNPAPRAADAGRRSEAVLDLLRQRGYVR